MKLGWDIARGEGHLVRAFDLKQPWPRQMVAILMVWNHIFALSSKFFPVIPTNHDTDIAGDKLHDLKRR